MKTKTVIASTITAGQILADGRIVAKVEAGHRYVKIYREDGVYFMVDPDDEMNVAA